MDEEAEDICGICGESGANKYASFIYWPGQNRSKTPFVHDSCENEEQKRAFTEFKQKHGEKGIEDFLRGIAKRS